MGAKKILFIEIKKKQPSKSSRNIHKFKEINRIKNRRQTTKKWPNDKIVELAVMEIEKEKLKGQEKDLSKEKNHISQKKAVDALAMLRSYFDQNDLDMHHIYEIGGQLSFNVSKNDGEKNA